MLDTTQTIETPEGIDLGLRIAGPTVRSLAWLIDLLIRIGFYLAALFLMSIGDVLSGQMIRGLIYIVLFVVEWFYPVLFEIYNRGSTPGKRFLRIRVVNDNGTPVQWSGSVLRNLLRGVDFLPFGNGIGVFIALTNSRFKRLGDLAAGTVVIYDDQFDHHTMLPEVSPVAPSIKLDLDEQQAIVNFAERSHDLTEERSVELADILSPLTGETGRKGISRLNQFSNWFLGAR